jgi:hypothetical protein
VELSFSGLEVDGSQKKKRVDQLEEEGARGTRTAHFSLSLSLNNYQLPLPPLFFLFWSLLLSTSPQSRPLLPVMGNILLILHPYSFDQGKIGRKNKIKKQSDDNNILMHPAQASPFPKYPNNTPPPPPPIFNYL